ncbi:MAG TPA: hypothetical protein VHZ09_11465 [Acidobacteriaceae bacterium]|nr:hypothetical protein [Acidobacteriaceae bacterium]
MNNPIPNGVPRQDPRPWAQPWVERRCSGSNAPFGLGVVLLVCGGAITGRHEATMIGLGMIIFSSFCDW